MKRRLYFSVAKRNKFTAHDCVKYYFPNVTVDEAEHLLWSETCFPLDTDMWLSQLWNLFLKAENKNGSQNGNGSTQ